MWMFQNGFSEGVGQKMAATFFATFGHVARVMLEDQKIIAARSPRGSQQEKTKIARLWVHAPSRQCLTHTAVETIKFLQESSIKLANHPTYSPKDIFLFPQVKKMLHQRFEASQDAVSAYKEPIGKILKDLASAAPELLLGDAALYSRREYF